ncbi:hypothetical protein K413DRAFT_4762 [Clostridium sp. ASBs410]|nr:hypothetical protein K413DRAFT_4762 [Clostridium sp. ASBs410]
MYPIIHPIEPFDSSVGTEIKFTWQGNQIYKVRCIVKNNETGATVYDHTQNTMKQSYVVLPNSGLINGTYYVSYITVFDINNNESNLQDIGTPFYCFSKPKFNLSVSDGEIIQTSAYKVGLNYSQAQGESLDSYSFTLYTYQKTVISSSGDIYNTSDMSYVISGLENGRQYYLRATGKTLHGITLDTGFILITVSYTIAQVFNTLELNNKAESGAIEIKSNIVSAIGLSEKDVVYIGDEYADLRDNSVTFDEGFEVKGDFTKIFVFYEPERNKSIIPFGDGDRLKVDIYYRKGKYADSNGEKAYFELVANSCGTNYVRNSGYVNIPNSNYQQFALLVNRQGGYYDLEVVVISTVVRYSASADGSNMTETKQANSRYIGIGYMPGKILEHENLLLNSNFSKGTSNWSATNNALISLLNETPNDLPPVPEVGTNLIANTNTTNNGHTIQHIYDLDPGTYTLSSYVMIPPEYPNSVGITKWRHTPSAYVEAENKSISTKGQWIKVTLSVILTLKDRYIFGIGGGSRPEANPLSVYSWHPKLEKGTVATEWTIAPSDWVADQTNYTWKPL